jgi:L-fuculose-phosphate aldolase
MIEEMRRFGKKLVDGGLVSSHFGNISIRIGEKILITRSGSMLDELNEENIVEVELGRSTSFDLISSSETIVHRRIYEKTSALAIIHVHSPFAVTISLLDDDLIMPIDSEGRYFLHEIPIIDGEIGSKELADRTANALRDHKGVIARGHGTFVIGKILEEAYVVTCMIEHSCKIKYLNHLAKR